MKTMTKEMQSEMTKEQALQMLKEGNQRFVQNKMQGRDFLAQAQETADGQYPFATVLSCIDSRVSSEIVFDQGIGDIFSIRVAGNVVNEDVLGSMEFACKVAGTKVILVLGHSACGAVKGACDKVELGNLTALLKKIEPAVESEKTQTERSSSNSEFVAKVTHINVDKSIEMIKEKSPILNDMVQNGELLIVGGIHDLKSGEVKFL